MRNIIIVKKKYTTADLRKNTKIACFYCTNYAIFYNKEQYNIAYSTVNHLALSSFGVLFAAMIFLFWQFLIVH